MLAIVFCVILHMKCFLGNFTFSLAWPAFFSSEIVEIHISAKTWRHVKSTLLRLYTRYSPPCFGNRHPTEHQRCKVENKTLNSIRRTTAAQLKTGDKNWKLSFWNTIFREKYKEKKSCKCAVNANDHKGEFLLLWIINRMMHMMSLKNIRRQGCSKYGLLPVYSFHKH